MDADPFRIYPRWSAAIRVIRVLLTRTSMWKTL